VFPNKTDGALIKTRIIFFVKSRRTSEIKYYRIEKECLKEESECYDSIGEVEKLFMAMILPWVQEHEPLRVGQVWDDALTAIGKTSGISPEQVNKFNRLVSRMSGHRKREILLSVC
jgi:hypothetical protein